MPFYGPHQAGILPTPQRQAIVVSFDVTAKDRGELTDLLRALTSRARFLTAGGTPPPAGLTGAAVRLRRARTRRGAGRPHRHRRGGCLALR